MEIKIVYGMLVDADVEDEVNDALTEGWVLRDTHVAVPDPGEGNMVGIWLVVVLERNNDQDADAAS